MRSERLMVEQINYNMLCYWFVAVLGDAAVWGANVFSRNRGRFMQAEVARAFEIKLLNLPQVKGLLPSGHPG